jgi:hypothetical protein
LILDGSICLQENYHQIRYIIEIWNASESVLIASQSVPSNSVTTITNNFSGLAPGTMYKLRVTINIAGVTTICAFTAVTTI